MPEISTGFVYCRIITDTVAGHKSQLDDLSRPATDPLPLPGRRDLNRYRGARGLAAAGLASRRRLLLRVILNGRARMALSTPTRAPVLGSAASTP